MMWGQLQGSGDAQGVINKFSLWKVERNESALVNLHVKFNSLGDSAESLKLITFLFFF